jgi:Protein of unknown function (DUF3987)
MFREEKDNDNDSKMKTTEEIHPHSQNPQDSSINAVDITYPDERGGGEQQEDNQDGIWPEIVPLDYFPVPEFPVEVLPPVLRDWSNAIAESMQVPVDMVAMMSFSVCSAVMSGKVNVEVKIDRTEPVNLYLAVIMNSGERKSPVVKAVKKPLIDYERKLIHEYRSKQREAEPKRRILQKRIDAIEKKYANEDISKKSDELLNQAAAVRKELERIPTSCLPCLLTDDITVEKLGDVLQEQDGRIACISAEGGVFEMMAGRCSKDGSSHFNIYLNGYSGEEIRIHRKSSDPVMLYHSAITIGLAVQPVVISKVMGNELMSGKGLSARFLYSFPESMVGRRKSNLDKPPMDKKIKDHYHKLIQLLAKIPMPADRNDESMGHRLEFHEDAILLLKEWEDEVELMFQIGGDLEDLALWGSKLVGQTIRISGLFHCVEYVESGTPWSHPIKKNTLESAIAISRYAIPHARKSYGFGKLNPKLNEAGYLWKVIQKKQMVEFSQREMHIKVQGKLKQSDDLLGPLETLIAHGYIRKMESPKNKSTGRNSSQGYQVNPELARRYLEKSLEQNLP